MADAAVIMSIGEMIDFAIGSPEVGVVDFNMLQTVLHCLAQQLRVLNKTVELRGSAGPSIAVPTDVDNGQTLNIHEFMFDTEADHETPEPKLVKKEEFEPTPPGTETMLVVERVGKSGSPIIVSRRPADQADGTGAGKGGQKSTTSAGAPPGAKLSTITGKSGKSTASLASRPSTDKLSLVTVSKFNLLENVVDDLKARVYGSMPKNEDILEEVRSQTNLKAITDMWTSLNVSSRLEAAEAGIAKLSSLVQDLIGEMGGAAGLGADGTGGLEGADGAKGAEGADGVDGGKGPGGLSMKSTCPIGQEEGKKIYAELERLRKDLDSLTRNFRSTIQDVQSGMDLLQEAATGTDAGAAESATATPGEGDPAKLGMSFAAATQPLLERLNALEKRLEKCCEGMGKTDGVVEDMLSSFQDQLDDITHQLASLQTDLAEGKLSPDLVKDLQGLLQLFQTVQEMQEQLKQVHETALQLAAEKEDRQHHTNALLEQIELLKTIKMDREDMVEAMAEKADVRLLARKVSHDQFEMACDDLSRGLEHTIGKLNVQEALWQQALDDIQREIESKLDKMELSPVKDFFNSKLRQLQENLKQMASLRREVEAAGTKKRLLRDVNCISCDAQAVMPMEATSTSHAKPMHSTLSMKPYLTYELDTIRKQQACNVPQRNMHDWETIDKQMTQHKPPAKVRSDTNKHLCNRYCGGSHTVTTAAQRVARLGHFIKQWGPDVVPLSSGLAAGDDGRLYKVSTNEGASVGPGGAVEPCTPKPQPRKSDTPRPPQHKPLIDLPPECRCLEGREDYPAKG